MIERALIVIGNTILIAVLVWALWPLLFIFANDGVRP